MAKIAADQYTELDKLRHSCAIVSAHALKPIIITAILLSTFSMELGWTADGPLRGKFPESWVRSSRQGDRQVFMTNKNPKIALDGYIRVFKSKDSAKQWTSDEANQLEKKGFRVLEQDTTVQAGNSEWHKLVWEGMMPTHGQQLAVRGEQYYFKGEETMIEVMIGGPPPLFDHLDHNELIQFLTSSNFSEKPKSSNETNAPVVDTRLCAPQDVLGSWELTFVEPQVNDGPDAYLYGYQRCYFGSDGKTKLLTSNKPFDDLTDIVWKNFPTNASYELDKKGIIAINDPGVGRIQYQACQIATGDSTKIKKGDMLLKSYRAEGAVHSIVKGFRKIGNNG